MIKNLKKAAPGIKVRDFENVNKELGSKALPQQYTAIPIYSYWEYTEDDGLNGHHCKYVEDIDGYYWKDRHTYDIMN